MDYMTEDEEKILKEAINRIVNGRVPMPMIEYDAFCMDITFSVSYELSMGRAQNRSLLQPMKKKASDDTLKKTQKEGEQNGET